MARTRAENSRETLVSCGSRQESIHPSGPVTGFKGWMDEKDEYSHGLRKLTQFPKPVPGSPRGSRSRCRRFLRRQGEPCPREMRGRGCPGGMSRAQRASRAGDRFRPAMRPGRKRIRHRTERSRGRPSAGRIRRRRASRAAKTVGHPESERRVREVRGPRRSPRGFVRAGAGDFLWGQGSRWSRTAQGWILGQPCLPEWAKPRAADGQAPP